MQKIYPTLPGGWEVVEKLGAGSSGTVYRAKRTTAGLTEWAAVKHVPVPKDEDELQEIQNNPAIHTGFGVKTYIDEMKDTLVQEYSQMLMLRGHTNIVTCFDIQIEPKADNPGYDMFIWMELLTSLPARINEGQMDRAETIKLGIDICEALIQLEKKRLVHRDIKPQNLFAHEDGYYKLGDFGTTRAIQGTSSVLSGKGTPAYMAPEIIMNKKANFTADIYSLGLVLYELMNGNRPPFIKPDEAVTHTSLNVAGVYRVSGKPVPAPAFADEELAKIILKACEYDPRKRWQSAADMQAALRRLQGVRIKPQKKGKKTIILLLVALLLAGGYVLIQESGGLKALVGQIKTIFRPDVPVVEPVPTVAAKGVQGSYDSNSRTVTLNWTGNASAWNIRYGYSGGTYSTKNTTGNSLVLANLTAGKTYTFYVYPSGDSYNGATSASYTYTIPKATPTPKAVTPTPRPTVAARNLQGTYSPGTRKMTLNWTGNASSWNVRYSYSGDSYTTKTTTSKSIVLSGLAEGKTYTFYVYPSGDSYNGATSASYTYAIPKATPTPKPTVAARNLQGTYSKSAGNLALSWTGNASSWSIRYGYSGGSYTTKTTSSKSIVLSGLTEGKTYTFYVYPSNDSYNGATSASYTYAIPKTTPTPKPTVAARNLQSNYSTGTQKMSLSWAGSASSWSIRYGYSGGSYTTKTTSSKSVVLSGLTEGKTYTFYVYPSNDSYNGATSTSLDYTIPTRPRAANVTSDYNSSTERLTLQWGGNATAWNIRYGYSGGNYLTKTTTSKSLVLSDLVGGKTYTFYVYPKGDDYNGDTSSTHSRAIPVSTKGKVSNLQASFDNSTGKITLTWSSAASAWTVRYGYSGYSTTDTSSKKMVLNLTRGKTYTFYVYPKGDSYNGATSASLSYTVPYEEKASNAKASYNSSTKKLTLTWSGSSSLWNIRYGYSGGSYTVKTTTDQSMVFSNLTAGKTYNFYVYPKNGSYNGTGSSSCSYKIPGSGSTTTTSSSSRTFSVSTSAKSNKGQVTFSWTDSESKSPYTLEYSLVGTKQYTYKITGISGKSRTVYDVIPGQRYKVVVKDKNGNSSSATVSIPKASDFSDGKLKQTSVSITIEGRYRPSNSTDYKNAQQVTLIAKNMTNGIRNKGYQFGVRYQINFPQLASTRTFNTMKVFRAPNGFQLAENNGEVTYSDFNNYAGGSYCYWYCSGEEFFRQLLNLNGSIPAGKYYVDLYWDGMFVKTQSFEVK